jgi:hypothetical protein
VIDLSADGPEIAYAPWTQRYSDEYFDRAQVLAATLTDWDREHGRRAPPTGYSERRFTDAQMIVKASREPRRPVCPRCLNLVPGEPGGVRWWAHPGPFTDDPRTEHLCAPCFAAVVELRREPPELLDEERGEAELSSGEEASRG